jgi:hypothetical protein
MTQLGLQVEEVVHAATLVAFTLSVANTSGTAASFMVILVVEQFPTVAVLLAVGVVVIEEEVPTAAVLWTVVVIEGKVSLETIAKA